MNDAFAVMPQPTAAIFKLLENRPLLKKFTLIGGTALALHVGHRISEDLDFITLPGKLPRPELNELMRIIQNEGHAITYEDNPIDVDDFENAGMDIHDSSQNWLIDGNVKVTFFSGKNHHERILTEPGAANGFRIATFAELCQLKAIVAASRSKSRDWLDLYVLERDHGFGLAQWKEAYDKAGLTAAHFEIALNRVCHGKTFAKDEGFTALMDNLPSLEEIASRFRTLREEYEIGIAKASLHKDEQPA